MKKSREMKLELVRNLLYWKSNFWMKVDILDEYECWNWKPKYTSGGYGLLQIRYGAENKRLGINSGRMAYLLTYEYIPENMFVCHHCDNPLCCNPVHLFLGTHEDNMRDMREKGRSCVGDKNGMIKHPESILRGDNHYTKIKPELILRGERHGGSKLKEDDVMQIYRMYFEDGILQKDIAKIFSVTKYAISDIIRGKSWHHLYKEYINEN